MSYQDPYQNQEPWAYNSGQQPPDYAFDITSQHMRQPEDTQKYYQWNNYGDPGHGETHNAQSSVDYKDFGYSQSDYKHSWSPYQPNRRLSQKSTRLQEDNPVDSAPDPVPKDPQYALNTRGFEPGPPTRVRRTKSAYRAYRYGNQGNLWTKNGSLRTAGRFCCCTVMTVVFFIVAIALALLLWIRPPNIEVGSVQPSGGLQQLDGGGFRLNLSTVISVDNFNYFNVDIRKIMLGVTYPINNTDLGGGVATNVQFKAGSETNFTFPFALMYDPSTDASGQVLLDIATKCGVGGQRTNIKINYKLSLGIQVLFFTVTPVISNVFSFACPVSASDISKLLGVKN